MAVNHLWVIILRRSHLTVFCCMPGIPVTSEKVFIRALTLWNTLWRSQLQWGPTCRRIHTQPKSFRGRLSKQLTCRRTEHEENHRVLLVQATVIFKKEVSVCLPALPHSDLSCSPGKDERPLTYSVGPLCRVFLWATSRPLPETTYSSNVCERARERVKAWRQEERQPLTFDLHSKQEMPQMIIKKKTWAVISPTEIQCWFIPLFVSLTGGVLSYCDSSDSMQDAVQIIIQHKKTSEL